MILFSYSNEDTKDEEGKESWSARRGPYTGCGAKRLVQPQPLALSRNAPQQLKGEKNIHS